MKMTGQTPRWRYPFVFWTTNLLEIFERAAFFGTFIVMTLYLTRSVGFTDIETGWVLAFYSALLYLVPALMGAVSQRAGFRRSVLLAFVLLGVGYTLLGAAPEKTTVILALFVIMVGGAMIKAVIPASVARCSDEASRARAFSLFYQAVNIGAFLGKMFARELRVGFGLDYVNYYAALMAALGLVAAFFFYKGIDGANDMMNTQWHDALINLWQVLKKVRFLIFLIIIGGFWSVQYQMYATMPKYVLRLVGDGASPEWISNINPVVVVIFVVPITNLAKRIAPLGSMLIAMLLMALSCVVISLSPFLQELSGSHIQIFEKIAMHPVTVMMVAGVAMQALALCFMQPRFLEYVSKLAPRGEESTYLGYSYIKSCFAFFMTFVISGYLLDIYCPAPGALSPAELSQAYAKAHHIWYIYAGIGFAAFLMMFVFSLMSKQDDGRQS